MCVVTWLCYLLVGVCVLVFAPVLLLGLLARFCIRRKSARLLQELKSSESGEFSKRRLVVGFFHPYCNAGGGGERVLWCMLRALQTRYSFIKCVVFTGDTDVLESEILRGAERRFNVFLKDSVEFIYLKRRRWVEAAMWPHLTLLGQSVGSIILGLEALWSLAPDVYIDTTGYAFTMPLFKLLGGCRVGCYVHYPTVSTDMLSRVHEQRPGYNNDKVIAQSKTLSSAKVLYYKIFAFFYMLAGKCSDVILVNSSWTHKHIVSLWKRPHVTFIVYPPCDTKSFCEIPLFDEQATTGYFDIVSVAQFRPEKDHRLQLEAFQKFYTKLPVKQRSRVRLILVGNCRDAADTFLLDDLHQLADQLTIQHAVEFKRNVSFDDLKEILGSATVGLHTMWNEHFGIGIVECMAAGAIILAHNSGGPKSDIVIEWQGKATGFLASSVQSYADRMKRIYDMKPQEKLEMKQRARASVEHRFSEETFEGSVVRRTERLFAW